MSSSYSSKYLKTYFWKGIEFILNIVSMLIVIPKLSSSPIIYGIYMVCLSTMIFLRYTDIGFVSAAYKYGSEYFINNKLKEETRLIGFSSFIMFLIVSVLSLIFLSFSFNPQLLISDISNPNELHIASKLFLTISVFSYNIVIVKFNQTVFGIRVENYIYQKVLIVVSLIQILSVYYFFNNRFDIIGYFVFFQTMNVLGSLSGLVIIKYRYRYDFRLLIKSFRFLPDVYNKIKKLAISSFYVSVLWIFYYYFDKIAISKFLGAEMVAYFSIGFVLLNSFKRISTTIFGPFKARFNHFIGKNKHEELKTFFLHVLVISLPIIIFPIFSTILLLNPLIYSWVGSSYSPSVDIAFFLLLGSLGFSLSIPTSIIVVAYEKINYFIIINSIMVVIFWLGIYFTIDSWGVNSFAIFKFVSQVVTTTIYFAIALKILNISILGFVKKVILPLLLPLVSIYATVHFIKQYLPHEMSSGNLIIIGCVIFFITLFAIFIYYIQVKQFRNYINKIIFK